MLHGDGYENGYGDENRYLETSISKIQETGTAGNVCIFYIILYIFINKINKNKHLILKPINKIQFISYNQNKPNPLTTQLALIILYTNTNPGTIPNFTPNNKQAPPFHILHPSLCLNLTGTKSILTFFVYHKPTTEEPNEQGFRSWLCMFKIESGY